MIWRDSWTGASRVAVISEQGGQGGELDAVVLALRFDTLPAAVQVTNEHGQTLTLRLPRDLDPFSINVRITLKTVEVTQHGN